MPLILKMIYNFFGKIDYNMFEPISKLPSLLRKFYEIYKNDPLMDLSCIKAYDPDTGKSAKPYIEIMTSFLVIDYSAQDAGEFVDLTVTEPDSDHLRISTSDVSDSGASGLILGDDFQHELRTKYPYMYKKWRKDFSGVHADNKNHTFYVTVDKKNVKSSDDSMKSSSHRIAELEHFIMDICNMSDYRISRDFF